MNGTLRATKQEVGKAAMAFHQDSGVDALSDPSTVTAHRNSFLALVRAKVQRKSILDGMFPTDSPR